MARAPDRHESEVLPLWIRAVIGVHAILEKTARLSTVVRDEILLAFTTPVQRAAITAHIYDRWPT